ncbi:MAG: hypothetical protein M3Y87_09895 [Myxococcota bacterium]|nr:hypothetical protein [Myxococcota bacterium]
MERSFVRSAQHARLAALALVSAIAIGAIAIAAVGLAPGSARATVMVEVPLEELVRDADAIVVGVVEHVGVRLQIGDGSNVPHTITTLRVREWIKGAGDELVRIDEIGGVFADGQGGMAIAGTPQYAVGDEVVVFLRRTGGVFRTYAMEQGHFTIQRGVPGVDSIVQRDLSAIGFASWSRGPMEVEHGGRAAMRVDDFLAHLRATLEQLRVHTPGGDDALGGGAR